MINREFLDDLDAYLRVKRYRLVNAVAVYENDELVFERYYNGFDEHRRNNLKSVWKSILSATLGICLDRGWINSVDDPVCDYLPEFARGTHPWHSLITIRHLLTMSSGLYFAGGVHYHVPMMEQMKRARGGWVAHLVDVAMSAQPGTKFQYKEWDVILLSALIGRAAQRSAWEICNEYLYTPLDIQSGRWPQSPCGIDYTAQTGETNSDLSAKDLAKIGLLFLHAGACRSLQIVSREYVAAATAPSDANPDYGFLWWLHKDGFSGRGHGGQELNVYPRRNAVAVLQATPTPSSKFYGDVCERIFS